MSKSTREDTVAELRAGFAKVYNELRRRGHEVIVDYEDPGNPLFIPQILELDGEKRNSLNLRFFIEPTYSRKLVGYKGHHWGVLYIPSNTARASFCERKKERSERLSKNQLTGAALADWVEQLLSVEKRSRRHEDDERLARRHFWRRQLSSGEISSR